MISMAEGTTTKVDVSRDLTRMGWRWQMGLLAWRAIILLISCQGPGPSHCVLHASISEVPEEVGREGATPARDSTQASLLLISLLCLGNFLLAQPSRHRTVTHKTMAGGEMPCTFPRCMLA